MNVLIVGLGSMGKRRVRCLQALGFAANSIAGFDLREDRRSEAASLYGIQTFGAFEKAVNTFSPGALIISVPPQYHHIYMKEAIRLKLPFFVEASVVDQDMEDIIKGCKEAGILAAPSSTLVFHPAISIIRNALPKLGKLSFVSYHSGQYLPDWHSYEHVRDYYVSNRSTSGGREIVPFELTWMVDVFGFPRRIAALYGQTIQMEGSETIDDTYTSLLDYGYFYMNLTVDVVSRIATRRLLINGAAGQLRWDWDNNFVEIFDASSQAWEKISYEMAPAQKGYASNIGENMYIDEVRAFIAAIENKKAFVNTLEKDHAVLKMLYSMEKSDQTSAFTPVDFVRW